MFAGMKIKIGDKELVIPAISLGQLRNGTMALLKQHDELIAAGDTFPAWEIRGQVLLSALRRNHPDFPEDEFLDYLDLQNAGPIWLYVLGVSGFAPGEIQAATAVATDGISVPSTEA